MTNRRQFLGYGLAASAWPVVGSVANRSAAPGASGGGQGFYAAICDRRYAAAGRFAAPLRAHGVPVHEIDGDVTSVWYHDLALRWRESPVAIAGLTGPDALFCLEQLAWDHRMRVVFRAEGRVRPDESRGGDEHLRYGADVGVRRMTVPALLGPRGLSRRPTDAGSLAEWSMHCPDDVLFAPDRQMVLDAPAVVESGDDAWLAWVIAPVRTS